MTGYFFLFAALICGAVKGYCGKMSGGSVTHASDAMVVNTVRMIFCILIGIIVMLANIASGQSDSIDINPLLIATSALSGLGTAAFTVSWLMSVRKGAYMMVDVFLIVGVIFPLVLCRIFFEEKISLIQWVGIILLIVAGYIMCAYNKTVNGKMSLGAIVMLILCALSNGTIDFSQKLFVRTVEGGNIPLFNLFTYVFAAIFLSVCAFIFRKTEKRENDPPSIIATIRPIIGYVAIMALCLFLHSYFSTSAAGYLDAAAQFPLQKGGALILSMLVSTLVFKEKINARCIFGVCLSFAALLLINLF